MCSGRERRLELLAAELAERLGAAGSTRHGALLTVQGSGGSVTLTSWGALMNLLQSVLAADEEALTDLAQLRGLCDRADSEAVLPVGPDEVGSDRGRRVWEYMDLVDRVTDRLVAEGVVDLKRLRATGAKGWYGRYMRSSSGSVLRLSVSAWQWGSQYPTPWWLRLWNASSDVEQALQPLVGHQVAHMYRNDAGNLYIGLYPPLRLDEDTMLSRLVDAVRYVCEALPPHAAEQPPEDAVADDVGAPTGEAPVLGD